MLARFLFFFFVYSIHVTLASLSFFLSFLVFFFVYIYISFSSFASPPPTAPRVFIFNEEVVSQRDKKNRFSILSIREAPINILTPPTNIFI